MNHVTNAVNFACNTVVSAGVAASVGYLCAKAFTTINPVNGAVFGAVTALVSAVADPIFNAIFQREDANAASRFVGSVLSLATGIAASSYISGALGYAVPLEAAATLTVIPGAAITTAALAATAVGLVVLIGLKVASSYQAQPKVFDDLFLEELKRNLKQRQQRQEPEEL